ncbi:hypothetical protein AAG906_037360 [Vitis piasezkii]
MLPRSILCAFVAYVDDLFKDTKEGDYAIMDHYEALGIGRNASKGEIKEAFRKLALKYHPDKHAQSPKAVRDGATLRFKQVSEAYEVLSDDRKRSLYNLRSSTAPPGFSGGYAHSYHYNNERPRYSSRPNADAFVSKFEVVLRFLTTRAFLLNVAFAGALLGGMAIVDRSGETLWKMNNSGKSFDEAMESIGKAKAHKDDM